MTDAGLAFIASVKSRLDTLYAAQTPVVEIETLIGGEEVGQFSRPPAVRWVMGRILHTNADTSGFLLREKQEYAIGVWAPTTETARELKNNILRYAFAIAGGSNIDLGNWQWVKKSALDVGEKLTGTIGVIYDVVKNPSVVDATILTQSHTESLDLSTLE
jgi:hypothetical protein